MHNDEKPVGLVFPDDVQRKHEKTSSAKVDTSITPAKPLEFEENGRIASIKNLLEQMRDGSQEFLEKNSHLGNTLLRNKAILCNGMTRGFLQAQEESRNEGIQEALEYEGSEHSLVMVGYFYHDLISLTQQDNENMVNAMLRRQAGPMKAEAERERGREWMRDKATKIWDSDHNQKKRIGEVANEVIALVIEEKEKRKMKRDESAQHWPTSPDKVKKAIRPVAPEYACRKGRPPNN